MSLPLAEIPVTDLKGVGTALALKLERLAIHTLQDLLFHLPLRYQDRTRIVPIGSLRPGDECVVEGEIKVSDVVQGRRRSLLCRIQDGTGTLTLRFFHFNASQKNNLRPGTRVRCFSEARTGAAGLEMVHPEYTKVDSDALVPVAETLTPVYPTTEGLHQPRLRTLVSQALTYLDKQGLQELLPDNIRQQWRLPELNDAIRYLHHPPAEVDQHLLLDGKHPSQRRLAFEELLAHHFSLLKLRAKTREQGAPVMRSTGELVQPFLNGLPFPLTGAQQRVSAEVGNDLVQPYPMLRLVQGDVGSGKTVVAALAALQGGGEWLSGGRDGAHRDPR